MIEQPKKSKFNIFWLYGCIALIIIGFSLLDSSGSMVKSTWNDVKTQMLEKGKVERVVVVNDKDVEVTLKDNAVEEVRNSNKLYANIPDKGPQFFFRIGSLEKFQEDFETAQSDIPVNRRISLEFEGRENAWSGILTTLLPILILIGFLVFMSRGMRGGNAGGGVFSVGKAKAQIFDKDNRVNVGFKDVAGLQEAKVEVMEIVDFLKNPERYRQLGGKIPKGALLVGPPGTGKTLLAKAVAGEANVPFFTISGSDFVEMFVGVGASRVRDLFRQAKEKAPCIVFIDEIDAIGRARNKGNGLNSNEEHENTLNQLLTEMDGFGTNSGVIILAATNRVDILDKALLRAGRFDRQIHIDLPELNERKEIFAVHLKKIKLQEGLDTDFLSSLTPGFSGADIANVCNEAALIAARHNKTAVERQDFLDAIDRIIGGLERKGKIITEQEKKTIAYHEAGHATVSWWLEHANPLVKVTIIPRGRSLGAAWYAPEERQITTKEQLIHEMASLLGGRASEKLIFGEVSTGALNDLERVTKRAYAIVAYYGMSNNMPNVSYFDSEYNERITKPYSEKRAEEIDAEVGKIIDDTFAMATEVLEKHKAGLIELAELLLEREVVFAEDLERIFGKRPGSATSISLKETPKEEKSADAAEHVGNSESGEVEKDTAENKNDVTEGESETDTPQNNDSSAE